MLDHFLSSGIRLRESSLQGLKQLADIHETSVSDLIDQIGGGEIPLDLSVAKASKVGFMWADIWRGEENKPIIY